MLEASLEFVARLEGNVGTWFSDWCSLIVVLDARLAMGFVYRSRRRKRWYDMMGRNMDGVSAGSQVMYMIHVAVTIEPNDSAAFL